MKSCSRCHTTKSTTEFHKNGRGTGGLSGVCKVCRKEYDRVRRASPSGKLYARQLEWNRQGIDMTHAEYTEKYTALDGHCEICNIQVDTLCVDHCHDTGEVRGLLCRKCNLALEGFRESRRVLANAVNYLNNYEVNKDEDYL